MLLRIILLRLATYLFIPFLTVDLFLVGMGILFFALVAELLWATFTSERKADDGVFHNEVFVCRLGKEVTTLTATQSVTTKDGLVWHVVDGKGQKHIYVKSQLESCFTISQDVLGYKDS